MKLKVTKKSMRNNAEVLLNVGSGATQYLLRFKKAFAYSAGVNGWDCDYYEINGIILSDGYRAIGEKVDFETIKEYEAKAEKISKNYTISYNDAIEMSENILNELIKNLLK